MAGAPKSVRRTSRGTSQRGSDESGVMKWLLIGTGLSFALIFLLLPLVNLFAQALSKGVSVYWTSLQDPDTRSAIWLTLTVAAISVPLNLIFGVAAAWAIAKFEFRGKALLITLIDLPFAISPVVSGLIFVVLFGLQGFFGSWLDAHDIKIIFALPGIVLATLFVTFPFVARELIPVMQATGTEVWLVPVADGSLFVPYYVLVPITAGTATLTASRIVIDTARGKIALHQ